MVLESDFPPDIRVENEISALISAGHELHIACYSHNKKFDIPGNLPFTIHKTYVSSLVYKASIGALKSGIYFNFWRRFLKGLFLVHSFDAIHIHDLPLAKVGYEFSRKEGIQFTLDLHENWPALLNISTHTNTILGRILSSRRQWIRYEKRYVSRADNVIVVVDEAKERITGLGADPSKIHVVSNTINPGHFDFPQQQKDENYLTLVYGGGVNYHRGLQTVIAALPIITKKIPHIRVWIFGSGSYLDNLQKLASDLNVDKNVEFFGWMSQTEFLKHVSRADISLIPHIKSPHTDSTIPHKLFQYMYAGIPIIASDCDPLQRIITETDTGTWFINQDANSFADNLFKLLADDSFKIRIPENGKKWVNEKYNWNTDSEGLVSIYQ